MRLKTSIPACLVLAASLVAAAVAYTLARQVFYRPSLRSLAEARSFRIGVSVGSLKDTSYVNVLTREFNLVTPENALKFAPLSPQQGVYDFTRADAIVDFALANNQQVRGHTLVWTNQLPEWLSNESWTREELIHILEEYVAKVVGRYRGRVFAWDVVNEALTDEGELAQDNFWMRGIGPEYIELAFIAAHIADPNALLFYNDFANADLGPKSNGVYRLMVDLLAKGTPVHGIGFELHTGLGWSPPPDEVRANMRRLAELGLEVHITEMDVRIFEPASPSDFEAQAEIYRDMLTTCLEAPNCTAFSIWGLSDVHSWIPHFYPGWGSALVLDGRLQPKPAYHALVEALKER